MRMMDERSWASKIGEEDDKSGWRWCVGRKGQDGSKRRMGEMGRIYVSLGLWRTMEVERNSEWRWREKVRRETDE